MAATASSFLVTQPPFRHHTTAKPSVSVVAPLNCCKVSSFVSVKARFGPSKGNSSVLERPSFDQSQYDPTTQVLEGGDMGRMKDKRGTRGGDSYRVLLMDDARHSEKLVAKIVPQAVPQVTPDAARELFHKSRENGTAVVIVTVKEHAEFYAQMMTRDGLQSTIEPDSDPHIKLRKI